MSGHIHTLHVYSAPIGAVSSLNCGELFEERGCEEKNASNKVSRLGDHGCLILLISSVGFIGLIVIVLVSYLVLPRLLSTTS